MLGFPTALADRHGFLHRSVFSASLQVRVKQDHISVLLSPAGTRNEKESFQAFLETINGWGLVLPGDAEHRSLRFRSHI